MADIKSINGNPIKIGTSGIEDGAVTDAKLASTGIKTDMSAMTNTISNLPIAAKSFVVPNGQGHSSAKDKVSVNIKAGEDYRTLICFSDGSTSRIPTLYAEYADGTFENVAPSGKAAKDITTFGVYLGVNSGDEYETKTLVFYGPLGEELYDTAVYRSTMGHTTLSKNLVGMEKDKMYRTFIPAGQNVVWAFADRSDLPVGSVGFSIRFYDKDKNLVQTYGSATTANQKYRTEIASADTDVHYISLSAAPAKNFQLELGNRPTDYEPYIENHVTLISRFDDFVDEIGDPSTMNVGLDSKRFHINAGSGHSSTADRMDVDIQQGESFTALLDENRLNNGFFDQVGLLTPAAMNTKHVRRHIAPRDITSLGLYVAAGPEAEDVTYGVSAGDSLAGYVLDSYDRDYELCLRNATRKMNTGNYDNMSGPGVFALAHFSDIHGSAGAMVGVSLFRRRFADYIDDTICTGDLVPANYSQGIDFWTANSDGGVLVTIGNHDSLGSDGWENPMSQQDMYTQFIQPFEGSWNAQTVTGHTYWYKDYADKKIRLISVDATIYDETEQTAQMTWFASALDGAKTNGYTVVGAIHFPPMPSNFQRINCNACALLHSPAGDMSQYAWHLYDQDILGAVDDFIDAGGEFACWLCGHTHHDLVSYDSGHPRQTFVTITCAMPSDQFDERDRSAAFMQGLAINTVCVDVARRYVKVLRYGAEWDDCLRHFGACVIDYSTSPATVVHES